MSSTVYKIPDGFDHVLTTFNENIGMYKKYFVNDTTKKIVLIIYRNVYNFVSVNFDSADLYKYIKSDLQSNFLPLKEVKK